MPCCNRGENYLESPSRFQKYPCKVKKEGSCLNVGLENLLSLAGYKEKDTDEEEEEDQQQQKEVKKNEIGPCQGEKPKPKKKGQKTNLKDICAIPYTRKWNLEETISGSFKNGLPKWFYQIRPGSEGDDQEFRPREPSEYGKKFWLKKCEPPKKPVECKEPVDPAVCVFCLESLYTGGYIHELFEKTPLIKKQSELYGDEVAWRIGIRTRIIVHKKCYNSYIDTFASKAEGVEEVDIDLGNEEIEDSEDLNCGEEEEEEEEMEEENAELEKDKKDGESSKKQGKGAATGDVEKLRKQHFCLRKFHLKNINPGENAASDTMGRFKPHGLVADLWPNIRLLQLSGHFLHEYHDDNSAMNVFMRKMYSFLHLILIFLHFAAIIANLAMDADDVNVLAANSITVLFFTHCITKFCYFALRRQKFYRTLAIWDTQNSHPLFAESHARHRAIAITKSRRLLMITVISTLFTVVGWTGSTFFGESTKTISDPENNNDTIKVEIPRLMLRAWYPWDASDGSNYMFSFIYQLYWLIFTLFHANLVDLLFCSWLIFACEQLLHVKEIMKPLIDLSSSLDTYNPGSSDLFKAAGAISDNAENFYDSKDERQINIRSIYSNMRDFGINRNTGAINAVNGIGPNGLSKKHEMLVRSAIKYWVERHKHIVRYVGAIGDAYGLALLLHMLTSTITLTLLAYQATKIDSMDLYAMAVLGYLFYSLAQVFAFCIYGNQLIEESSSVMEAAYSCQWYDGSEEAKTFVQIVCQQCQKALSISGAKFFTVSLDLFASVLGAVVTYFMVLVQLK